MPQRKTVRRFDSSEVQGEDSFIEIRAVTYGERQENRGKGEKLSPVEQEALALQVMSDHVIGWNWVDDDGKPLPLPKDDFEVMKRLTLDELNFIGMCVNGNDDDTKKK